LRHEVGEELEWADAGPAEVVLGTPGEGWLAQCPEWPGLPGAVALIHAGFERMLDRRNM
jgi:hypothetical protein